MAPHAQLDLDRFLPYRLSVLSNRISTSVAQMYSEHFQLTITEWRVMAILGRYPDLSANEVAQRSAMDKVAVSRAVALYAQPAAWKRLQKNGMRADFSWGASGAAYAELYRQLLEEQG